MYISRSLFSSAYAHLKQHANPYSISVLVLCALDTDSLCATRILERLLKHDYIRHQLVPVAGFQELERVNEKMIKDNEELKFVICLGLGGLVDMSAFLDLTREGGQDNVECWVIDGRRPWNLYNVFGGVGKGGEQSIKNGGAVMGGQHKVGDGVGGVKCFDDGDIAEEMEKERDAYKVLVELPDIDDGSDSEDDDDNDDQSEDDETAGGVRLLEPNSKKRKSSENLEDSDNEDALSDRSRRPRIGSIASEGPSTPVLHRHTLLSTASSRPLDSSPPPLKGLSRASSPQSQILPAIEPPAAPATTKELRKKLRRLRRNNEAVVTEYYSQGTWYGEPVAGLMYSLAADLGREDNDLLWLAIVGVCAGEIYGRTITSGPPRIAAGGYGAENREAQIRGILEDEVRRLNPPEANAPNSGTTSTGLKFHSLQTTALSPDDTAIRISPEYRFMMIRHWSLYDSMLHSPYLGTKLHIWSEHGKKRLHKLLAKMGFSLSQCKQSYTHMDMDLKRTLKEKLERYAPLYGLDGVIKKGFVRCWGWRGCLSAADVGYVIGGILEIGRKSTSQHRSSAAADTPEEISEERARVVETEEVDEWITNFWAAYDALEKVEALKEALPTAMDLHRAILRTGTALLEKRQIKPLRAFLLAVVKEGPDLGIFAHPNALSKLGLWLSEAILEQEREYNKRKHLPLVIASLNERRGVYVVVGTAMGAEVANLARVARRKKRRAEREEKRRVRELEGEDGDDKRDDDDDESDSEGETETESDDDDEGAKGMGRRAGRNRFGIAFQEVASSTQARIRIDSFEATVVEVRKEDLAGFLEGLSLRSVVG